MSRQTWQRLLGRRKSGGGSDDFGPEPLDDRVVQIRKMLDQGKAVEAMRLAQDAVNSGVRVRNLNFILGHCLERVGRHEEARNAYQGELELFPGHAGAKARRDALDRAWAKTSATQAPDAGRSWHTCLPHDTLIRIQQSLHHYTYRGVPMLKNPFDLALYPLLIWQEKPLTIFEIGSKSGGSGLWLGDMLTAFGLPGHVYSLDIVRVASVSHPKVTFLEGDGRALEKSFLPGFLDPLPRPWLVIEDADHAYETSIATLRFFHPWLRTGEYIVVEDGIISDLEQDAACNSGPHRALKEWSQTHSRDYELDTGYCDFFGHNLTWCTNGFLKKIAPAP